MAKRSNYDSGSDYLLKFGELKFSFNEMDFRQRVEQAASRLGFVEPGLTENELRDLLALAVRGEIVEPLSALGEHINELWPQLTGPRDRSLVYWLRKLVFRGAWLDQMVKEGELDVVFDDVTRGFGYIHCRNETTVVELRSEPSWAKFAYHR